MRLLPSAGMTLPLSLLGRISAAVVGVLMMGGCASSVMNPGNCERYPYEGYNVIVCDDGFVHAKCRKSQHEKARITGEPYRTDNIRACLTFKPWSFGRKPVIRMARSYMECLGHEIGHFENPDKPEEWVAKKYPCIGDPR